jgi:signal transduction histidine kinase
VSNARDRFITATAIVVLVSLAGIVAWLVLDAQRAGIHTRESGRLEQVQQLARDLDTRVQQAYTSLQATVGAPGSWRLTPNDPADAAKLRPTSANATSGNLLVDANGTLLNGSLLLDKQAIGTHYSRGGLDRVLDGQPMILDIGPGLTTATPVISIGLPVRTVGGDVAAAYILESRATADSPFSQEIAQLRAGRTGAFVVVDASGRVAASTDESTLGQASGLPTRVRRAGFHHDGPKVVAAADIPTARWSLVFEQSTSEFQGDLTRPLRAAVIVLTLLVLIGGVVSVVALNRRLRSAHEEQRRLADISVAREEFASIVSHELRTPVAGLLGFLQTTVDHWPAMGEDERQQAVRRALENAERLQHLSADVLESSAVETGHMELRIEPVDLRSLTEDAAATVRAAFVDRTITVEGPAERVEIDADGQRLRQVIGNVIDNAVKNSPIESPVHVTVDQLDGAARVAVRDHGTGIASDDRERIFEKYTRVGSGVVRGTGLGLYLAREIVRAHGGRIWVADTDGPGTTIVFTIPAREHARG